MLLRVGLIALALPQAVLGTWAMLAPRSSHADFPGGGRAWISPLGPYDEHLVVDVGALSLALVAVLVAAAWSLERRLVTTAAVAWLLWSLPHLIYHLGADDPLPAADRLAGEGGQLVSVVVALAIIVLVHLRRSTWDASPSPSAATPSSSAPTAHHADGSVV